MARVDERGLSTAVGYALHIVVATLLLSTLLVASGGLVEDQRERVARAELEVVGERFASDLMTADRLAESASTVRVRSQLPGTVAGVDYRITVTAPGGNLTLVSSDPSVTVRVPVGNTTDIEPGTVRGGEVAIVLADDGDLEVSRSG